MRDGKNMGLLCRVSNLSHKKPISFNYDAISYSKNFDEGNCHVNNNEEPIRKRSLVINCPDDVVRWDLQISSV